MAGKTVLILSARHRPIEITVLIAFLLVGAFGLISPARIIQELNKAIGFGWLWYAGIAFGSLIALISVFLSLPTSILWERIGLTVIATFIFGYTFAAGIFFGWEGVRSATVVVLFGVGCIFRSLQITKDLRLLTEATK